MILYMQNKIIGKSTGQIDSTPQDLTPRDSTPQDLALKSFLSKYEEPIETFYSSDIFGKRKIETKEINNVLANKKITGNEFLKIYNVFINKLDEVRNKKAPGARGSNQKKLLDYGNELKKIIGKSFNPSGSGLKILTPQQMFTRFANTFSTNKSRK